MIRLLDVRLLLLKDEEPLRSAAAGAASGQGVIRPIEAVLGR